MDAVKKEFTANNFCHAFTIVDAEFPVDGDASVALKVMTPATYDTFAKDLKSEVKTLVRRHLKTWEVAIGYQPRLNTRISHPPTPRQLSILEYIFLLLRNINGAYYSLFTR